jgi:hypothetical protein
MIELVFESEGVCLEVFEIFSCFGKVRMGGKLDFDILSLYFLVLDYNHGLEKLKRIGDATNLEGIVCSPVNLLVKALETVKMLFESGKYLEIVNAGDLGETLYDVVEELGDIKKFKDMGIIDVEDDVNHLSWKRLFLTGPIVEMVYKYKDNPDPLASFMKCVYLNVSELVDFFEEEEVRLQLLSETYVRYTLVLGLDCILQEDCMNALYELPVVNDELLDKISTIFSIVDGIIHTLQKNGKMDYEDLIYSAIRMINQKMYVTEEVDVLSYLNEETVKYFIQKLDKTGIIQIKRNTVKYVESQSHK